MALTGKGNQLECETVEGLKDKVDKLVSLISGIPCSWLGEEGIFCDERTDGKMCSACAAHKKAKEITGK